MDPTVEAVRYREDYLPNWICDICSEDYSLNDTSKSADFCILQGYDFSGKEPIPAGEFSLGDLFSIFPEKCLILVVQLTGDEIVKTLTVCAQGLPDEDGALIHVSQHLKYTIDLTQKSENPKSPVIVKDVLVNGSPIDLKKAYSVAITDTLSEGGFGITWMKNAPRIVEEEYAAQIQDLIELYCKTHINDKKYYPANPSLGRITIIGSKKKN